MAQMSSLFSAIGNGAQSAFGTSALSGAGAGSAASGAGTLSGLGSQIAQGTASGTPVSSTMGGISSAGGLSNLDSLPMGAGGGMGIGQMTQDAISGKVPQVPGFLSDVFTGLKESTGMVNEKGEFDGKKVGGYIGASLGRAATNPSNRMSAPSLGDINIGSAQSPQNMQLKQWALTNPDSYIALMLRGN